MIYLTFSAPQRSVKPAWAEMEASSLLFAMMELFGGKNVNVYVSITLLTFSDDATFFLKWFSLAHTLSKWSWMTTNRNRCKTQFVSHLFAHCSEKLTILWKYGNWQLCQSEPQILRFWVIFLLQLSGWQKLAAFLRGQNGHTNFRQTRIQYFCA